MRTIKITTKNSEQIATAFAAASNDVRPIPDPKKITQTDRLAPYRKEIIKLRRRGFQWSQIVQIMAHPAIDEKVSVRLLIKVFGDKPAVPRKGTRTVPSPVPPAVPA
jgi:hypothetical protein